MVQIVPVGCILSFHLPQPRGDIYKEGYKSLGGGLGHNISLNSHYYCSCRSTAAKSGILGEMTM